MDSGFRGNDEVSEARPHLNHGVIPAKVGTHFAVSNHVTEAAEPLLACLRRAGSGWSSGRDGG